MAKLVVRGADRDQAVRRAKHALDELVIDGVRTVLPFDRAVVAHPDFADEFRVHTGWIAADFRPEFETSAAFADEAAGAARTRLTIDIDGRRHELGIPLALYEAIATGADVRAGRTASASPAGNGTTADSSEPADNRTAAGSSGPTDEVAARSGTDDGAEAAVTSPYAGTFVKWLVDDAAEVTADTAIAVIEAMKMESDVTAGRAGTVSLAEVSPGDEISAGTVLARVR